MKKIILLFLLICVVFSSVSCGESSYTYAEFTITLPRDYLEYDSGGVYDLSVTDGRATLGINRISFVSAEQTGLDITFTPADFAKYYMNQISGIDTAVKNSGDVPYYSSIEYHNGSQYFCIFGFYRSRGAYFISILMVDLKYRHEYEDEFVDMIDNVILASAPTS